MLRPNDEGLNLAPPSRATPGYSINLLRAQPPYNIFPLMAPRPLFLSPRMLQLSCHVSDRIIWAELVGPPIGFQYFTINII